MIPLCDCPECDSTENHVMLNDLRNWLRFLLEIPVTFLKKNNRDFQGLALHRKCDQCGKKFLADKVLRHQRGFCRECNYNLTGNQSGKCPECGREISE